ncbi:MAG: protein kinase [Xanthomonadales bacterium]|nr:protein kinase [Xanthomonadales bacterium]
MGRTDRRTETDPGDGRALVERIARAYREAGGDAAADAVPGASDRDLAGQRIGPWRLLARIGRGGMGEVYRAERADGGYQAQVAVKLLRAGIDGAALAQRFRRERQILARLEHPGIARLIDGGSSEDGLPYLAMELVDGTDLLSHARARRLDLATRLRLFIAVCDAVACAHRNLVVHRDLKPSNILVDESGRVRLLDFGIGKLLEHTGNEDATLTRTELLPMTVAYAAPEQILGEPVSTATDVYALGVLLHELLTGTRPHLREGRSLPALASAVDTEQPTLPSEALARSQAGAADRPGDRRLPRLLRGDLDTIVLTALRREPDRRYASAAALAEDLRRHLEGQPIRARPDSRAYRLAKFLRRHRLGVVAAALVLCALVTGVVLALSQAQQARVQAQRAEQAYQLLLSLYRDHDPLSRARLEQARPAQLLVEAAERAATQMAGDPAQLARTYTDLAELLANLGDLDRAEHLVQEALSLRRGQLPPGHPDLARSAMVAAHLARLRGRHQAAGALADEAAAALLEALGPDHPDSLRAQAMRVLPMLHAGGIDEAIALARGLVERQQALTGPAHVDTARRWQELAVALEHADRVQPALQAIEQARTALIAALGEGHPALFSIETTRGDLLRRLRDYQGAVTAYQRSLDLALGHLGPDHPLLAGVYARQADMLRRLGRLDEADRVLETAAALAGAADRIDQLAQILAFRGRVARAREDWPAAIELHRQGLAHARQAWGEEGAMTLNAGVALARTLAEAGDGDAANQVLQPLLPRLQAHNEGRHLDLAVAQFTQARIAELAGDLDDAVAWIARCRSTLAGIYGPDSPATLAAAMTEAELRIARGHDDDLARAGEDLAAVGALLEGYGEAGELSRYDLLWHQAALAARLGDAARRSSHLRQLAALPASGFAREQRHREAARLALGDD